MRGVGPLFPKTAVPQAGLPDLLGLGLGSDLVNKGIGLGDNGPGGY